MDNTLLATLGAFALTTTLAAQPPTPATQPVRPPDRPTGQPTSPLPAPEPDLGRDRKPRLGTEDDPGPKETRGPVAGTLTLQGCLRRTPARTLRLHPVKGNDATVTEDVLLGGALEPLREHVGQLVEVRGSYEQATPAGKAEAIFSVDRVKRLTGTCPAT